MLSIYSPKLIIIKILMKIASEINEQSCIFELFVWKIGKEQMSIGCVVIHLFVHLCLNQATVHIFASKARSCSVTRVNREPKSTTSHEPTSSQPRVKSNFFLFFPEKKVDRRK